MSDMSDTRDRVIKLETEMAAVKEQLKDVSTKLNEIHEIFLQAKGARYLVIVSAAIFGFVSAWFPTLLSYFSGLPR